MSFMKNIVLIFIFSSIIFNELCLARKKPGKYNFGLQDQKQHQIQETDELTNPVDDGSSGVVKGFPDDDLSKDEDIYTTPRPSVTTKRSRNKKRRRPNHKTTEEPSYFKDYTPETKVYEWDSPETQKLNEALAKYMQSYQQQSYYGGHQEQRPLSPGPIKLQNEGAGCFISSHCKTGCCVLDSKTNERTCRNMSRLYEPCNDAELKGGAYSDYCPCEIKSGVMTSCVNNVCQISRGYQDYAF